MSQNRVPLPSAIIPFLLGNLEGFDVWLEEGERIVLTAKAGVEVNPASRAHLDTLLNERQKGSNEAAVVPIAPSPTFRPSQRPKFIYKVKDQRYTPAQAKRFGLSKPRLLVYEIIHASGNEGTSYAAIKGQSKLIHGSVMQVLHWLRKQKLITGVPAPTE